MVLVTVLVVGLAGFAVYRLQGAFGSHDDTSTPGGAADEIVPFNPKRVLLEVFGDPGTTATITYMDVDSSPQRVDGAVLPWSYDGSTT
ncbi:MAG: transport acessory protein MmpS, partial [Mycobacterium sp.]